MSSSLVYFKNGLEYITRGDYPGVYPFDEISAADLGFKKLSRSYEALFYFFSSPPLV